MGPISMPVGLDRQAAEGSHLNRKAGTGSVMGLRFFLYLA